MNIGIVEDDLLQRTALKNWLESAGHQCDSFDNATDFIQESAHRAYQLLLLDWEMPGMSGIELLRCLRTQLEDSVPVIFITARDTEEDIVQALSSGADDYLVKPARQQELLARIDALVRRSNSLQHPAVQRHGNIHIDPQRREIRLYDERVELTQKEYDLACYLLDNIGKLHSRNVLLENVWGHGEKTHSRTVDTHISRLRKKLALNEEHGWQLSAVYQYGYRLDQLAGDKGALVSGKQGHTLNS